MLIVTSRNLIPDTTAVYNQYQSMLKNPQSAAQLAALHHTYGMPSNGKFYTQQEFGRLFHEPHSLQRFKYELDHLLGQVGGLYNELQRGTRSPV